MSQINSVDLSALHGDSSNNYNNNNSNKDVTPYLKLCSNNISLKNVMHDLDGNIRLILD